VQPVSVPAKKTRATSGHGSQMELLPAGQNGVSLKTSKDTFLSDCATCCETWQDWVTDRRGEYSRRKNAALHTDENGFSSWPTPTTQKAGKISNQPNFGQIGLSNHPSIVGPPDRAKLSKSGKHQGQWPTPRTHQARPGVCRKVETTLFGEHLKDKGNLEERVAITDRINQAKLNPDWVEQLMGLPLGWTALTASACSETESCPPLPHEPLPPSTAN